MDFKSQKFGNDHVSYRMPVAEPNVMPTPNTGKHNAKIQIPSYNDLNGSQNVISCEDNALYPTDDNLGQNICRQRTLREASTSSSQNDTKGVKHSLKDQTKTADDEDPYSESVNSDDSTIRKVPYEDENQSFKRRNRSRIKNIQVGNDNIMIISKQSESTDCKQFGNKNIMIHLQVYSNQFKTAGIDDRDSEEVWLKIKRKVVEGIEANLTSNGVLKELKDDLNSDSSEMKTSDYSSICQNSDFLSTPSKYWEDDEEHYATIAILKRKDSLRIQFEKKHNKSVLNTDNLAGSPIMSHKKVQDFLRDNGNDFDVTIGDWENDSEYDFIPSFSVDSDQWNGDWSIEQNCDAKCQYSYLWEVQNRTPQIPKRIIREGIIRGYDGETKHQGEQALPPIPYKEASPARSRSGENQSSNVRGPPPLPAKTSRLSKKDVEISLPSSDNMIDNDSDQLNGDWSIEQNCDAKCQYSYLWEVQNRTPQIPKRIIREGIIKGYDGETKHQGEQALPPIPYKEASPARSRSGENQSSNVCEPPPLPAKTSRLSKKDVQISLPSSDNMIDNGSSYPNKNQKINAVNTSNHDTNVKQSTGAGSAVVTKKSKPIIPPKPKIPKKKDIYSQDPNLRKEDVNPSKNDTNGEHPTEAGSATDTKKSKPTIAPKPKIRIPPMKRETAQQTNTVTIKPTSLLKPPLDQQDLPADISSLSTEVNSRNKQRAKEVNDSEPKLKQDRERSSKPIAELVEESDGLESCPIKNKKMLDLITCYSNVKEFKREEYMHDNMYFESPVKNMPVGTFLVRPGKSIKDQVLVIKASTGSPHKFQIHEKQGLYYILEKDAFSSIDELVRYYSLVALPSTNFRNVLERGAMV